MRFSMTRILSRALRNHSGVGGGAGGGGSITCITGGSPEADVGRCRTPCDALAGRFRFTFQLMSARHHSGTLGCVFHAAVHGPIPEKVLVVDSAGGSSVMSKLEPKLCLTSSRAAMALRRASMKFRSSLESSFS